MKLFKIFLFLSVWMQILFLWPAWAEVKTEYGIEGRLHEAFYALSHRWPSTKLQKVDALLEDYPDFGLLHLLRAETLSALAHRPTLMTTPAAMQKRRMEGLWHETMVRLAYRPPPAEHVPEPVLLLSDKHRHMLIFSASQARLFLFANRHGVPRYIKSFYASIGYAGLGKSREGDNKTPLGIYHPVSRLNSEQLPSLYGAGAYPINYPNAWDKRRGRYGSGIWLHGVVPGMYSRPPRDSRGCIIVSNSVLEELQSYLEVGSTPIFILRDLVWLPLSAWRQRQKSFLRVFLQWQTDWESLDVDRYLSHYSRNYSTEKHAYQTMVKQTRKNAEKKTFVKVNVDAIDIFQYPGEIDLVMVVFNQDYQSNNYKLRYRKQQFWEREDDWKIVYEGRAESLQR